MDWQTIQTFLARWLASATGLPASNVIWEGTNVEGRSYPYATLALGDEDDKGQADVIYAAGADPDEVVPTVSQSKEFSVTCRVYANTNKPAGHARKYLSAARSSLSKPSVIESFGAAELAIVTAGPSIKADLPANLGVVSSSLFELRLANTVTETDSATSYIQTTEIEGEVSGAREDPTTIGPDTYGDTT